MYLATLDIANAVRNSAFRIKYAAIPQVPRDDKSKPTAKTKAYNFLPIIVFFPKGDVERSQMRGSQSIHPIFGAEMGCGANSPCER